MKLGPMDYLIQQNWVNASGGFCASSYDPTSPDFSLSVSPNSQSAAPGSSTGNYVVKVTATNSFAAAVSLSASPLPAGATASFTLNPSTSPSHLSPPLPPPATPPPSPLPL